MPRELFANKGCPQCASTGTFIVERGEFGLVRLDEYGDFDKESAGIVTIAVNCSECGMLFLFNKALAPPNLFEGSDG